MGNIAVSDKARVQDLLARLRQHQQDWPSWLVYADWLTDQGDTRGEIIALEHQLAVEELADAERSRMLQRVATLTATHQQEWLGGWSIPRNAQLRWQYGFVTSLRLHLEPQPLVVLSSLRAHTATDFLVSVELSACPLDGPLEALSSLERLALRKCSLGPAGARALAQSDALRGLRQLDLYLGGLGDDGAAALASCEALDSLEQLELQSNQLGPRAAAALAHGEALCSVERLVLRGNRLGDEGVHALAHATSLGSLASLDLDSNGLGPAAARALARMRLRELDLGRNALGDEGALALADMRLERLNLWGNGLQDEGKNALMGMRQRGCQAEW